MTDQIYAIGYARVSTQRQANEGESLEIQADFITPFILRNGWKLFPENTVLQEAFTGGTDRRPVYELALSLIRKNPGKVRYFVVRTIDRFSREGSLKYQQMKAELADLGVELRDIGGTIQPTVNSLEHFGVSYPWSLLRPSAISEVVLAETANHEKATILTRLIGSQIKLTQEGFYFRRVPDGYRYERTIIEGKKRYVLAPDPERAPFFRTIFEMRALGAHTDAEIVARVNAMGYTTRATNRWDHSRGIVAGRSSGRLLTVKALQRLITRTIYCGVSCGKWTHGQPVRARCTESLITVDLFNRANRGKISIEEKADRSLRFLFDRKAERARAHRIKFSLRWPYKRLVACPACRRPLHASASRGKSGEYFPAYHCQRKHARYSMPQPKLDAAVREFLSTLRLPEAFWDRFDSVYTEVFEQAKHTWEETHRTIGNTVADRKRRLAEIAEAFVAAGSEAIRRELDRKAQELQTDVTSGEHDETPAPDETRLRTFLRYARSVLEHPLRLLDQIATYEEHRAIYGLMFAELPTYQEIRFGTPKLRPTFELVRRIVSGQSLQADLTDLSWNSILEEIEEWERSLLVIDLLSIRVRSDTQEQIAA